jgi:hypothetical protein
MSERPRRSNAEDIQGNNWVSHSLPNHYSILHAQAAQHGQRTGGMVSSITPKQPDPYNLRRNSNTARVSDYFQYSSGHGQHGQMIQQQMPVSSEPKIPQRQRNNAPLLKLTTGILETYLSIGNVSLM